MIPVRLAEVESAEIVRGEPNTFVASVVSDSRLARARSLFVCLRGSRADGHHFVSDAVRRGAVAALCERGRGGLVSAPAVLEAADPLLALGRLARLARRRAGARVVGVAGSAGKTSTKDALRALLAPHVATVASEASHNNELGVPLTLSRIEADTEVCVCELGTGAAGELAGLCGIAEPDAAIITAIGPEHLEFFGSVEAVAHEEAQLISALPPGAPLVLPYGEPLLEEYLRTDLETWRFGLDAAADVHPLVWRPGPHLTEAAFSVRGRRVAFATNLRLLHHRLTLAAALAAYAALGLPLDGAGEAAAAIALSPWRGDELPRAGGGLLINDAYNANPVSVHAALEALASRRNGARAVAVLGEMAELGAGARSWHALAGADAAALGVDLLVAVGPGARAYVDGATGKTECCWFPDRTAAARALPGLLHPTDVVLIKGSRSAGLERLADAIVG